jgi:serine/threonine protein kinase
MLEYYKPDIPVDFLVDIIKVVDGEEFVYVIFEDCGENTLETIIREREFDEESAILVTYEILRALQVVKNFNLHHGGIFPANIYEKNGSVKLGLPSFKKVRQRVRVKSKNKKYYAPEKDKTL